jgi:hypothetical protein
MVTRQCFLKPSFKEELEYSPPRFSCVLSTGKWQLNDGDCIPREMDIQEQDVLSRKQKTIV